MTPDEIQQLAADMRQYLGVDATASPHSDIEGGPISKIWINANRTVFLWTEAGEYRGADHVPSPTRLLGELVPEIDVDGTWMGWA